MIKIDYDTGQISNKIIKSIKENSNVEKEFVKSYIMQMNTKDLMIMNVESINKKIQRDFNHLEKLKNEFDFTSLNPIFSILESISSFM